MYIPMILSALISWRGRSFTDLHRFQHHTGGCSRSKSTMGRRRFTGMCVWVRTYCHLLYSYHFECLLSFGLLHRIPPPPGDREPGTVPPELFENPDEFEEQQLFVPADISQRGEQYNGWSQNFHSLEEEFEENYFPTHNGHNGHAGSDDDEDGHHSRDHDHKHGNHEYDIHSRHEPSSFRTSSSNRPRVMTPTGDVRNGNGSSTNGDSRLQSYLSLSAHSIHRHVSPKVSD